MIPIPNCSLFRTFHPCNAEVTKALEDLANYAFRSEGESMIKAVQDRMAGREFWDMKPVVLKIDHAGILVRRILDKLKAMENKA